MPRRIVRLRVQKQRAIRSDEDQLDGTNKQTSLYFIFNVEKNMVRVELLTNYTSMCQRWHMRSLETERKDTWSGAKDNPVT